MRKTGIRRCATSGHRLAWFVVLWLAGVAGAALLVLPLRILIALAMHHSLRL